jgi:hypothetical protein
MMQLRKLSQTRRNKLGWKQRCGFFFSVMAGLCFGLITSGPASASEGSTYGGPVGGTDISNGLLPPNPGFYLGVVNQNATGTNLYGSNGKATAKVDTFAEISGAGLTYVYPVKPFGGTLASSLQEVYEIGHFTLELRGVPKDHFTGWGDTYTDVISWSKHIGPIFGEGKSLAGSRLPYGLTVKVTYSMILPTGRYSATRTFSPGHNDYFMIPNVAFTYLTPPNRFGDGFEIDGHYFQDFSTTNPATHYYSGTVGDFDFALTQKTGRWQYGLQGFYADQFQNDLQNGAIVKPGGKRLQLMDLGPLLAYSFPELHSTLKSKFEIPIYTQNSVNTYRLVFLYTTPL